MSIDFGNDSVGKLLQEHIRCEERYDGIFVIEPYADTSPGPRSPRAQAELGVEAIKRMASLGLIKTAIWDTITNTAREITAEFARQKVNSDEHSKHYSIRLSETSFLNTPGINWRDNGMAQNACRYAIRDPLVKASEPFHFIMIGHEVQVRDEGIIGVDIAGKAAASNFPGGKFPAFLHLVRKGGKRGLYIAPGVHAGLESMVVFKHPPGKKSKLANENGVIVIPEDDFDGSVEIWRDLYDTIGENWLRMGLYGAFDTGKSIGLARRREREASGGVHGRWPVRPSDMVAQRQVSR